MAEKRVAKEKEESIPFYRRYFSFSRSEIDEDEGKSPAEPVIREPYPGSLEDDDDD